MARMIDADALQEEFKKSHDGKRLMLIDTAPTVDAVPVVRCKDCKHCFVDGDNVRFNVCELNHNRVQAGDWFCADGERKGGDDDAADN